MRSGSQFNPAATPSRHHPAEQVPTPRPDRLDDLLYLSTSISDNTPADALFTLTPPADVNAIPPELGIHGTPVRHTSREATDRPAQQIKPPAPTGSVPKDDHSAGRAQGDRPLG